MSKEGAVIGLGAWIIVLKIFFGLPEPLPTILFVATGIALIALGFFLRSETLSRRSHSHTSPYVENTVHRPVAMQDVVHNPLHVQGEEHSL